MHPRRGIGTLKTGLPLRNLSPVTVVRQPYHLLYTQYCGNLLKFLNSNPENATQGTGCELRPIAGTQSLRPCGSSRSRSKPAQGTTLDA